MFELKNGMIICHSEEKKLGKVIDAETKSVRLAGQEEATTLETLDGWAEATAEELEGTEFAPAQQEAGLASDES